MFFSRSCRLGLAALIACSMPAVAGAPDPLDASAAVAPLLHESAFAGYRRHLDASPRDWKATNETVGRIGGWRAYAREASAPTAVSPGTPASAVPTRSPGPHDHGQPRKARP